MKKRLGSKIERVLATAGIAAMAILAGTRAGAEPTPSMVPGGTVSAVAPPTLEQRVEQLEQRQRDSEAAQEATVKSAPLVTAGKNGFGLTAADGSFRVRLRGMVHVDGRVYADDDPERNPDTITARRARIILEGTLWKYYDFTVQPEFGDGKLSLLDAHLSARFLPELSVRIGKFKAPVGLERLQVINDVNLVELALPTNLVPNRDVGLMIYGELFEPSFSYAVSVSNGVPDGQSSDKNADGRYDYHARVFFTPFKYTNVVALRGLGLGVGGSSGLHYGTPGLPEVPSYKSAGQSTFFKYLSDGKTEAKTVVSDGRLNRLALQGYYFFGPFGLIGEYVESCQEVRLDRDRESLSNTSWEVTAAWVLTGEAASFKAVRPRRVFDPLAGSWGAWQIVGRYNELTVDDDAFPVYASRAASARMAHGWGVGVTGFLNDNLRVMLDYEETAFVGGSAWSSGKARDLETEQVWFWRTQIAF